MANDYLLDGYRADSAALAPANERTAFIQRTYGVLFGAVLAFVGLEALLLRSGAGKMMMDFLFAQQFAWIGLMVLFVGGGYLANWLARADFSPPVKYAGLALYVGLEAIIFLPIMTIAEVKFPDKPIALQAGILTLLVFGGLTAVVFISKKDFSFMGPVLSVLSFLALGAVICGALFGFSLGLVFAFAMIALASGFIIYDTSNMIHHYSTREHVAAALSLFASLALLFWYIMRILMSFSSND